MATVLLVYKSFGTSKTEKHVRKRIGRIGGAEYSLLKRFRSKENLTPFLVSTKFLHGNESFCALLASRIHKEQHMRIYIYVCSLRYIHDGREVVRERK